MATVGRSARRRRLALWIAVAVGLIVGGGSVAYAVIPGSDGVIDACYNAKGQLRVIDVDAGASCAHSEKALTWNQTGPQGEPGPAGSALAHAYVSDSGVLDAARSKGIAGFAVSNSGEYCFKLDFAAKSAIASPENFSGGPVTVVLAGVGTNPFYAGCGDLDDAWVTTANGNNSGSIKGGIAFYVMFN